MSTIDLTQIFEEEFAKPPSAIEAQAAVAALGDEYPAGLDTYSWVSRTELVKSPSKSQRQTVVSSSIWAVGAAALACGSRVRQAPG